MESITLSDLQTLVIGLAALLIGTRLTKSWSLLSKLNIPTPVVGGVLVAVLVAVIRRFLDLELLFSSTLTDLFLLIFFTTVGLSAKLAALRQGGRPLLLLCAVTVLLIVVQNLTGIAVALGFGADPYYGLSSAASPS